MMVSSLREDEELDELKRRRMRLFWLEEHVDQQAIRRIDTRIKELEKKTRVQT